MKTIKQRILPVFLSLAMLALLFPSAVFAAGQSVTVTYVQSDVVYTDDDGNNTQGQYIENYLKENPNGVTPANDSTATATIENGTFTVPKASGEGTTEEGKPSITLLSGTLVCTQVGISAWNAEDKRVKFTDGSKQYTSEETSGAIICNVIPTTAAKLQVVYYWTFYPQPSSQVTYDYNLGTGDGKLPEGATVYPGEEHITGSDVPYANFTGDTLDTKPEPVDVTQNSEYTIQPPTEKTTNDGKPQVNVYPVIDIVGRSGTEGNYTYYELLGWKSSANDQLYQIGDTAVMGEDNVTYTAQWQEVESNTLDGDAIYEKVEAAGLELPLAEKYYDDDYPGGTDAQITQSNTGSFTRENDTADNPLLLGDDRTISYRASMQMNDTVVATLLDNQDIRNPEFANFNIEVKIGDKLNVLDKDGTVEFAFTCTFLKPTGEIQFADGTTKTYTLTTQGDEYFVFKVPAEDFTSNSFSIPVKWIPGRHSKGELTKPITLEVARAQIDSGYTGVVETTGHITGSIDFSKANVGGLRLSQVASDLASTNSAWQEAFDYDGDGRISAVEAMRIKAYVEEYAAEHIDLYANSVYVQYRPEAIVQPADLTIYMGGTEGYKAVMNGNTATVSNSLPEPGFYITLPDVVNQALKDAGETTEGEAANLSSYLKVYTQNGDRKWTMEAYGDTHSGAYGKHIYRIVPDEGQDPVRMQFTDETGKTYVSDTFDPMTEGNLSNEYTMSIYPGDVNLGNVLLDVKVNNTTYTCKVNVQSGYLYVRYVTGGQEEVVTPVAADIAGTTDRSKAYAVAPEDTKFFINESQVDVTDTAAPSLLFDEVVSSDNTTGAGDYRTQLAQKAAEAAGQDFANVQYQAKYLDLVDANNGNVWLKASQPVTVYWPFPEGTDANTKFYLVHFKGLNREMATGDVTWKIEDAAANGVPVTTSEYGVSFMATDGFSPFVLMWETPAEDEPEKPTTGGGDNGGSTPTPTPQRTPAPTAEPAPTATPAPAAVIPQTGDDMPVGLLAGLAIVAAGGLAALLVLRKRRSDR